mmetsp:Transcript_20486/g.52252  ORF Transcript_20486/g.52252 Transcript_20486/m.52252 type:complete len:229 (+) Transcript_20486:604-1290(+)
MEANPTESAPRSATSKPSSRISSDGPLDDSLSERTRGEESTRGSASSYSSSSSSKSSSNSMSTGDALCGLGSPGGAMLSSNSSSSSIAASAGPFTRAGGAGGHSSSSSSFSSSSNGTSRPEPCGLAAAGPCASTVAAAFCAACVTSSVQLRLTARGCCLSAIQRKSSPPLAPRQPPSRRLPPAPIDQTPVPPLPRLGLDHWNLKTTASPSMLPEMQVRTLTSLLPSMK